MTDAEIIATLTAWGGNSMTYVAANRLRSQGHKVTTAQVRRRLERLERDGRVERVSSPYLTQICWQPTRPTGGNNGE